MLVGEAAVAAWWIALAACRKEPEACASDCGGTPAETDTGGTTVPGTQVVADLLQGGVVVCVDPSLRNAQRFDRRTATTPANSTEWLHAGGILSGDFDGDDVLDFLCPAEPYTNVYRGEGDGGFQVLSEQVLAGYDTEMGVGGSVADYDGDADLDILLLRYDERNLLLRNDGNFLFTEVGLEAGLSSEGRFSMVGAWSDWDHDGDLDLVIGNYGSPDHTGTVAPQDFEPAQPDWFYVNNGDGTFTDRSDLLPQDVHDGYTYVATWFDADLDGWDDLYFINDFGPLVPNTLLFNREGVIFEQDVSNTTALNFEATGMGLGLADYDGDGVQDLLIPQWKALTLHKHSPAGLWIDNAQAAGITPDVGNDQEIGWGADLVDIDNDADLDGYVVFGHVDTDNPNWVQPHDQPDALFLNDGTGHFSDVADAWDLDDLGVGRGFIVVDFNGDGYLDIAKRDLDGPNVLHLSLCGENAWARVALRQPGQNAFAVGARIEVETAGQRQTRWVMAGGHSFQSGGPPEVHFGLGVHDVIDLLRVTWPDGAVSEFTMVDSRQTLTVTRQ